MLISIVIPTYNRVQLLIETIDSILSQTYSNFELIIVSDGATDNTKYKISELKDTRIKFIELDKNYGYPAKARNEGVNISNGKYIAFCDDDDLWEKNKLEKQVDYINRGYNFIFTNYKFLKKNKTQTRYFYLKNIIKFIINKLNSRISYFFLTVTNPVVNSSVLVKKSLISRIMFNDSILYRAVEDYQLWIQIYQKSNPFYINEELVMYRLHDNNISNDFNKGLKKCLLIMKNLKPKNNSQIIFKIIGNAFYFTRCFFNK